MQVKLTRSKNILTGHFRCTTYFFSFILCKLDSFCFSLRDISSINLSCSFFNLFSKSIIFSLLFVISFRLLIKEATSEIKKIFPEISTFIFCCFSRNFYSRHFQNPPNAQTTTFTCKSQQYTSSSDEPAIYAYFFSLITCKFNSFSFLQYSILLSLSLNKSSILDS